MGKSTQYQTVQQYTVWNLFTKLQARRERRTKIEVNAGWEEWLCIHICIYIYIYIYICLLVVVDCGKCAGWVDGWKVSHPMSSIHIYKTTFIFSLFLSIHLCLSLDDAFVDFAGTPNGIIVIFTATSPTLWIAMTYICWKHSDIPGWTIGLPLFFSFLLIAFTSILEAI